MTKHDMMIENSLLRAALKPFALAAKSVEDEADNAHLHGTGASLMLCAGDLRKAAARLTQEKPIVTDADVKLVRPPSMEQDPKVIDLAKTIFALWMSDHRFLDHPMPYFWAELAARAALDLPNPWVTTAKATGGE